VNKAAHDAVLYARPRLPVPVAVATADVVGTAVVVCVVDVVDVEVWDVDVVEVEAGVVAACAVLVAGVAAPDTCLAPQTPAFDAGLRIEFFM